MYVSAPVIIGAVCAVLSLLVILGSKVWVLSSAVSGAASRDQLNAELAIIRKEIGDRSKESQDSHRDLASKSALTRIDDKVFDVEKELRNDVKEMRQSVDQKLEKLHMAHLEMLNLLMKINNGMSWVAKVEAESKAYAAAITEITVQLAQLKGATQHG